MTNQLITREYQGKAFTFRSDGYFNMAKAAKHFGKDLSNFLRSPVSRQYCCHLSQALGLYSVDSTDFSYGLAQSKRGRNGGTWGHPKLAVFFARWLDPKFAVFCDAVIDDILHKNAELTITRPEQSAVMQLPQSFADALRLAAGLADQNEVMSRELNFVTVDEYRALTHRYFEHSYKTSLGQTAGRLMRERGLQIEKQTRDLVTAVGIQVVHVNVYPRAILVEAEAVLAKKRKQVPA